MPQTKYLDTETAYWVISANDAFSVEVVTPWDDPTTVSPFATATDAEAWIAEHRQGHTPKASREDPRTWGNMG